MAKKSKKSHKARKTKRSAPKKSSKGMSVTQRVHKKPASKGPSARPLAEGQVQKFRDVLTQKRDDLLAVVQRKKEQEIQVGEVEIGDEADIATRSVEKEM